MASVYKNKLERFNQLGIDLYRIVVAAEVENYLDNYYNEFYLEDEDFDAVCDFIYAWIQNSEAQASEVVEKFFDGLRFEYFELTDLYSYETERKIVDTINSMF